MSSTSVKSWERSSILRSVSSGRLVAGLSVSMSSGDVPVAMDTSWSARCAVLYSFVSSAILGELIACFGDDAVSLESSRCRHVRNSTRAPGKSPICRAKPVEAMDVIIGAFSRCLPCFPDLLAPHISLNGSKYKIIRLLGEGGFSYVYLVSLNNNPSSLYALKKIRCPFGTSDETYKNAMREVGSYHRFSSSKTPYIVQAIDDAVVTDPSGTTTVYVLLPYFHKLVQDVINSQVLNNKTMEEQEILRIFIGVCRGLQIMHKYSGTGSTAVPIDSGDTGAAEDDELLPGGSEQDDGDQMASMNATELRERVPYAHRDIKPANVMLSAEGLPVLVDLGSCSRARVTVTTRQQALSLADFAQEHCTLPYRAPELLDVTTGAEITEKTDIWSLGCFLYCCCFGVSPFEKLQIEQGANINLAISQGKYSVPDNHDYSPQLMQLVENCVQLNPQDRPSVDQLLESALAIYRQ